MDAWSVSTSHPPTHVQDNKPSRFQSIDQTVPEEEQVIMELLSASATGPPRIPALPTASLTTRHTLRVSNPRLAPSSHLSSMIVPQDHEYQRMVADVADQAGGRLGALFSRGAFDKGRDGAMLRLPLFSCQPACHLCHFQLGRELPGNLSVPVCLPSLSPLLVPGDLLYLRDEEERRRHVEEEQMESEAAAFAAARAVLEREQQVRAAAAAAREAAALAKRRKAEAESRARRAVPLVRVKPAAAAAAAATVADEAPAAKRARGEGGDQAVGAVQQQEGRQQQGQRGSDEGEEEEVHLGGLLGGYGSSEESDGDKGAEQQQPQDGREDAATQQQQQQQQ